MTDELKTKIEAIRELVVNTTSGKWVYAEYKNRNTIENVNGDCIAKQVYSEDGKYIAAVNPAFMQALLDKMDRLNKEADWLACQLETKEHACEYCYHPNCGGRYGFEKCGYQGPDNWRTAARKAVGKENEGS